MSVLISPHTTKAQTSIMIENIQWENYKNNPKIHFQPDSPEESRFCSLLS
jgi:hypothetical protein